MAKKCHFCQSELPEDGQGVVRIPTNPSDNLVEVKFIEFCSKECVGEYVRKAFKLMEEMEVKEDI